MLRPQPSHGCQARLTFKRTPPCRLALAPTIARDVAQDDLARLPPIDTFPLHAAFKVREIVYYARVGRDLHTGRHCRSSRGMLGISHASAPRLSCPGLAILSRSLDADLANFCHPASRSSPQKTVSRPPFISFYPLAYPKGDGGVLRQSVSSSHFFFSGISQ